MFERYSDRARKAILMAFWSAQNRGGSYIEPEDLLHALIREDRGEFAAVCKDVFPGPRVPIKQLPIGHRSFFDDKVAKDLLRELHADMPGLKEEAGEGKLEPAPHVDLPISHSLKRVLGSTAQARRNDTKIIEPLHLLAAIVEDRDSPLAELLRNHGITRQKVAEALDSET